MCRYFNTPPSIIKWKKVQHERVAPWKNTQLGCQWAAWPVVAKCVICVYTLCVIWVNTHQLHKYDYMAGNVTYTVFVCACVCFPVCVCGWMSLCTTDWASDVVVENTNLAGTSKAVCHVGAALLEALLTHCISQHFSLFTVAHAKPP